MAKANYSKATPVKTGYRSALGGVTFFLLLESGDSLLFEDGSSKLILESSAKSGTNYSEPTVI